MMTPAVWTAFHVEQPITDALRWLNSCGWKYFELSTEHLQQINEAADRSGPIEQVKATLRELGSSMPQAHAMLKANVAQADAAARRADIERMQREMDCCAKLGVRHVVIHPGAGEGYTTTEDLRRIVLLNVQAFKRLGDLAGELGMKIGIENMTDAGLVGKRRFGSSPHELMELLDRLDHPALGITLDTSHASVQNLDIPATIREFGPRILCTHVSDNDGSGDQHRTPGNGRIDWPAVMKALRGIGYAGLLNLEIPGERHNVPEIQTMKVRWALEMATWLVRLGQSGA